MTFLMIILAVIGGATLSIDDRLAYFLLLTSTINDFI
jgi:hypothetical protein